VYSSTEHVLYGSELHLESCQKLINFLNPAPALEAIEYVDMDFIAEFNSTSLYRGPPTPAREKAWFDLTYSRTTDPQFFLLLY
jgi:hypothetical protein